MSSHRFNDVVNEVTIDYIIWIDRGHVLIDAKAIFPNREFGIDYKFSIYNKVINWNNVDCEIVSLNCRKYCQKLVSLGIFS